MSTSVNPSKIITGFFDVFIYIIDLTHFNNFQFSEKLKIIASGIYF